MSPYYQLRCDACSHVRECALGQMGDWLRGLGMLKRDKSPEPELIVELFTASADRFRCTECGHTGMTATPAPEMSDDDWPTARLCEMCGKPIGRERLEALPEATLCTECRAAEESGTSPQEAEYCPRCGTPMSLRPTSGRGITRYAMTCPQCRRR